jgi:hypothetical protein
MILVLGVAAVITLNVLPTTGTDTETFTLLRDLAFPTAVTAFVLVRLERRLRELTHAIQQQTAALARHGFDLSTPPPPLP